MKAFCHHCEKVRLIAGSKRRPICAYCRLRWRSRAAIQAVRFGWSCIYCGLYHEQDTSPKKVICAGCRRKQPTSYRARSLSR